MRTAMRRLMILFVAALAAAAVWGVWQGGRYLQHEDPLRQADAIFVLAGTRMERPLEAADLYREQWAPVIALSPGRTEPAEETIRARGVPLPRDADVVADALSRVGVPRSAIVIPRQSVDNTADEALMLRSLARERHWRTVIVVTSKYHTRRSGFAMRRALEDMDVAIILRATRYDPADPANWWRRRYDARYALSEWEKLVAYRLGLANRR
jgi:uncharacterized SAM-binding protein YcdF (DUF218 family)